MQGLIDHILERSGYRVLLAGNPQEALTIARRHQGTIHLLMTNLGNQQLASRLRAGHPDLKALYVCGALDEVTMRHGFQSLATNCLPMPFSIDGFARKVREVIDRRSGFASQ